MRIPTIGPSRVCATPLRHGPARPAILALLLGTAAVLFFADPAQALQVHPPPEGLYAHLLGHILFFLTSCGLFVALSRSPLSPSRGWLHLRISSLLFAVWNVWTFTAHVVRLKLETQPFVGADLLAMTLSAKTGALGVWYYFLSLDHVVAVPAMLFFVLGLRSLLRERTS
jgi:hypothetical protein